MDWKTCCITAIDERISEIERELKPFISGRGRVSPTKAPLINERSELKRIKEAISVL